MRFKVDENLPAEACGLLAAAGYDATTVCDEHLGGHPDFDVAIVCASERRALIPLDTDFGNILAYPPSRFPGIIGIRADDQPKPVVLRFVRHIIDAIAVEPVSGKLWIVERSRIRIRASG